MLFRTFAGYEASQLKVTQKNGKTTAVSVLKVSKNHKYTLKRGVFEPLPPFILLISFVVTALML